MSLGISGLLLLGSIGVLLVIVGAVLIKRGAWPARIGNEPNCRSCGYSLIGIDSERCPECGAFLSPLNVLHGRRHRRWGLNLAGVAILVLGLCPLAAMIPGMMPNINWYHYKPTFLVMHDLRSSSGGDAYLAMVELERREKDGDLSSKYEQRIVELALVEQASTRQTQLTTELISFLQGQYFAGHLTDAQKSRFGQQATALTILIRPTVVQGNQVPFVIQEHCRVTGSPFWTRLTGGQGQAFVDGKETRGLGGGSSESAGIGSGGSIGTSFEYSVVGKHVFEQTVHVEVCTGPFDGHDPKDVVSQGEVKVSAPFEIVAAEPAGAFKIIDDPTLAEAIRAKVRPHDFTLYVRNNDLNGQFNFDSVPINLAFDVFVRVGEREFPLGVIMCIKGSSTEYSVGGIISFGQSTSQPTKIDIVLRSSEKVARGTVDMHDMWKGELVYPDVPVRVDATR